MNKDASTVLTLPSTASHRAPVEAVVGEVRGPKGKIEEKCADLYSIIRATELVEELYYENMTESYEYTVQCKKLILQFDITLSDLIEKKAVSRYSLTHSLTLTYLLTHSLTHVVWKSSLIVIK